MADTNVDQRQCLYRGKSSKIFDGPEAVEAALEDGWVEHPDDTDASDEPQFDNELEACSAANDRLCEDLDTANERITELEAAGADLKGQLDEANAQIAEFETANKALTDEKEKLVKALKKK